jgi:HEAT repeat protein
MILMLAAVIVTAAGGGLFAQQDIALNRSVVDSTPVQNAIRLIKTGDRQDMLVAIQVIESSNTEDPEAIRVLSCCLEEGISFKRRKAARIVNDFWDVRMRAAQALGNLGDPRGLPALHEALRHEPEPLVKSAIVKAMGQIGMPESIPHLLRVSQTSVRDANQDVVIRAAIRAVLDIGHPDGYWVLYGIIKESCDYRIRKSAEEAMDRLL